MKKITLGLTTIVFGFLLMISCESGYLVDDPSSNDALSHEETSDYIWNESDVIDITLNTSSITCSSGSVTINGSIATITAGGTYRLAGTLSNGQIIVNSSDGNTVRLILNNAQITCLSSAPIYIQSADKMIIALADNSTNTITDGTSYTLNSDGEPDAAIYSKADLTIFGNGTLTVNANYQDGICSKDGLIIKSGTIYVNAVNNGIKGKDFLDIKNGTINVNTQGDGLKSNNDESTSVGYILIENGNITISSGDDGIHAASYISISKATVTISRSVEGIESKSIVVNSGNLSITASDDGFNATYGSGGESDDGSSLSIHGGRIYVNATGGDGLDSNGDITITGGTIISHGPQSQPEVGMDYNGTCKISGGVLIVSGPGSNMTQGASTSSSQNSLKLLLTSSLSAGTIFHIQDSNGNEVITFKPNRGYSSVIFSSPLLKEGSTYSIYTGGSSTGTNNGGVFENGTYSPGTLYKTFTVSSVVTTIGSSGPGGPQ